MKLSPETMKKLAAIKAARASKAKKFSDTYREYIARYDGKVPLSTALDSKSIAAEFSNFSFAGIISDSCKECYITLSENKYGHLAIANYLGKKKDDLPGFIKFRSRGRGSVSIDSYIGEDGNLRSLGPSEYAFFINEINNFINKLYETKELIDPRYSYIFDGEHLHELHIEGSMMSVIIRTIARENGFGDDYSIASMDLEEYDEFLEEFFFL